MREEAKASLGAVGAGHGTLVLGAICGTALGYALMPAIPDGRY